MTAILEALELRRNDSVAAGAELVVAFNLNSRFQFENCEFATCS